ncbi:MAG: hypothetical protein C7B44_03065 [Sulfobacillus thermosulfidooxidans]|nr:MAG: hypothetical protein C7B44_03065 [Sulfobacillus thermosulfidooxidans]
MAEAFSSYNPSTTHIWPGLAMVGLLIVGMIALAWLTVNVERLWTAWEQWRGRMVLHALYSSQGKVCILKFSRIRPMLRRYWRHQQSHTAKAHAKGPEKVTSRPIRRTHPVR